MSLLSSGPVAPPGVTPLGPSLDERFVIALASSAQRAGFPALAQWRLATGSDQGAA